MNKNKKNLTRNNKLKEKISEVKKKQFYFNLLFMLILNTVLLAIYYKTCGIYFAINDDTAIAGLMAGVQNSFPGYSVYINFIPSYFISKLATIVESINWYGVYLLITFNLSFTYIGAILVTKMKLKIGIILYTVVLIFGAIPLLSYFSFTTVAYLAIVAGVAFIVQAYYSKYKTLKYVCYALGILMFINGSLIRYKCMYTGAVLLIGFIIVELIKSKKKNLVLILVLIISIGISFGTRQFSRYQYKKDVVWSEYLKFNSARSSLIDFGLPNYYQNTEFYESIGWSENDYKIFNTYAFPENEKFSTETLEKIYEYKQLTDTSKISISDACERFVNGVNTNSNIQISLIIILIIGIYNIYFTKNKFMSIALILFPIAMNISFIYMNRAPYRVVYPHYFISIVLLLIITNDYSDIFNKSTTLSADSKVVRYLLTLILVSSGVFAFIQINIQYNNRQATLNDQYLMQSIEVYDTLCSDQDNVYLTSMDYNGSTVRRYTVLRWNQPGTKENVISCGGWLSRSKNIETAKEKHGISNLLHDLLYKDNYYFVDKGSQVLLYETYFKETYNLDVVFDVIDTIHHANIYKVSIADNY